MRRYSLKPRKRTYVKVYEFLSMTRKYRKQLLDIRLDSLKNASKKFRKQANL